MSDELNEALQEQVRVLREGANWLFDLIYTAGISIDRFEYERLKEIKQALNNRGKI